MATEATTNITNFLKFCVTLCEEAKAVQTTTPVDVAEQYEAVQASAAAAVHPAAAATHHLPTIISTEEGDMFFDAIEIFNGVAPAQVEERRVPLPPSQYAQQYMPGGTSAASAAKEEELLSCLRAIQRTGQDTQRVLEGLAGSVARMEENIAALRGVLAPGAGSAGVLRVDVSSSGVLGGWGLGLLGMGLVAASAASLVYLRSRQRGSSS